MKELIKTLERALERANEACAECKEIMFDDTPFDKACAVRDGIVEALAMAKKLNDRESRLNPEK